MVNLCQVDLSYLYEKPNQVKVTTEFSVLTYNTLQCWYSGSIAPSPPLPKHKILNSVRLLSVQTNNSVRKDQSIEPPTRPVQAGTETQSQVPEPEGPLCQEIPGQSSLLSRWEALKQQAGHERPGTKHHPLLLDTHHQVGQPAHTGLGLWAGLLGKVSVERGERGVGIREINNGKEL